MDLLDVASLSYFIFLLAHTPDAASSPLKWNPQTTLHAFLTLPLATYHASRFTFRYIVQPLSRLVTRYHYDAYWTYLANRPHLLVKRSAIASWLSTKSAETSARARAAWSPLICLARVLLAIFRALLLLDLYVFTALYSMLRFFTSLPLGFWDFCHVTASYVASSRQNVGYENCVGAYFQSPPLPAKQREVLTPERVRRRIAGREGKENGGEEEKKKKVIVRYWPSSRLLRHKMGDRDYSWRRSL